MSVSTPSKSLKYWLMRFWKTSWADLMPKGVSKWCIESGQQLTFFIQGYLPIASICILFGEPFAFAIRVVISSMVGSWRCSLLMALFRYLGSKQMCKRLSGFSMMAIELTQSVGSSTLQITPRFSMSSNSVFTLSLRAVGIVLGGFTTGVTVGSTLMW